MPAFESRRAIAALLVLSVVACYLNSFSGDFQFDDYKVIVGSSTVHSWQAWFDDLGYGIRPLLKFSYTLDWMLGPGTFAFHFTNVLIHAANGWLVFRLSEEFLRHQGCRESFKHVPLLTALLFVMHPAHTEAVTYISGRSISLMTLFYLAALLAYATGREHFSRRHLYIATPMLFLLALGVKEIAVTFPLALLAWEASCGGNLKSAFKHQWPNWLLLLVAAIYFLFSNNYQSQMERSVQFNSLAGNIATQLMAFAYLLRQWILPLWPNIDPDLSALHDLSGSVFTLLPITALALLAVRSRRSRPWLGFALLWAMIHLVLLYLFLPRIDIANDRQLYLASWPLLMALVTELSLLLGKARFHIVMTTLVAVLAVITILRNRDYISEITLWKSTVRLSPAKARVHNNLGYAYLLDGRKEDARREFILALHLDPKEPGAKYNLESLEHSGRN